MTLSLWAGTFGVFAVLMVADLALTRKTAGFRTAATSSALWIAAALAFGGALWLWRGRPRPVSTSPATCWKRPSAWTTSSCSSCCSPRSEYRRRCSGGSCTSGWSARSSCAAASSRRAARSSSTSAGSSTCSARWWYWPARACSAPAPPTARARTWPCAGCAGSCRSPATTRAAVSSSGSAARPWPRPCSWPWWPSRSPTWCSRSTPSRRSSASPGTCSWCSRPTPSPSSACERSTSCWPARWTGSPTSSRESPSCWCSSAPRCSSHPWSTCRSG